MHTSLSDALHFLVGVLRWAGRCHYSWWHRATIPSGMCLFQLGSSVELIYFRAVPALAGLGCRPKSLLRQGVCPSVSMSIHVLSDFFRYFPKSSFSVSPHVPRSILSMCLPAPLASSCHSSLSMFKQKHYVHLWFKDFGLQWIVHIHFLCRLNFFWLAQGSSQPLAKYHPCKSLPLVASAVELSKPRYTDAASVKLLIFANGVVLFKVRKTISYLWGGGK